MAGGFGCCYHQSKHRIFCFLLHSTQQLIFFFVQKINPKNRLYHDRCALYVYRLSLTIMHCFVYETQHSQKATPATATI